MRLRLWTARLVQRLDDWSHEYPSSKAMLRFRSLTRVCELAEISYGWGPDASDWDDNGPWWMFAAYRWFRPVL